MSKTILSALVLNEPPLILFFKGLVSNLNFRTEKVLETGMHPDSDDKRFMSSVLFINTNDGYSRIGTEKCPSTENTLITIPSHQEHTGTTCTNAPRRLILNIVYLP
jgi:hypothetical protein